MNLHLICIVLCAASTMAQKQTEVVTRTGSYLVEETIITDSSRQREEHRNNVTDARGIVTQHVVVKLFAQGLVVSYSSHENICLVGKLDKDDMPVPAAVFDDVTTSGQVTATEGTIVNEDGAVHKAAVDDIVGDVTVEVQEACGDRIIQMVPRSGLKEGQSLRFKRKAKGKLPLAPPLAPPFGCGREMRSRKKCASKTTFSCCKQCQSSLPYCFKDYYFEDIRCSIPTSYGAGGHGGSYGASGSQTVGHGGSYGASGSLTGGHGGSYGASGSQTGGHVGSYGASGSQTGGHGGSYGASGSLTGSNVAAGIY